MHQCYRFLTTTMTHPHEEAHLDPRKLLRSVLILERTGT